MGCPKKNNIHRRRLRRHNADVGRMLLDGVAISTASYVDVVIVGLGAFHSDVKQ